MWQETKIVMEKDKLTSAPPLQRVKASMESSGVYNGIFPELFKFSTLFLSFLLEQQVLNDLLII